jgi:hypothetical protein
MQLFVDGIGEIVQIGGQAEMRHARREPSKFLILRQRTIRCRRRF